MKLRTQLGIHQFLSTRISSWIRFFGRSENARSKGKQEFPQEKKWQTPLYVKIIRILVE